MHCPSHFLFTTERGDRVEWILIDSFGFPEIISPRMHQGNWISNSPPPCLSLCLPLHWEWVKPCMNYPGPAFPPPKTFPVMSRRHTVALCVRQQRLKLETRTAFLQTGGCNVRFCTSAQTRIWFADDIRERKLPWALNTMLTFTQSYWNVEKKQASFLTLKDQKGILWQ